MPHGFLLRCNLADGRIRVEIGQDGNRADAGGCSVVTAGPIDPEAILARHLEGKPVDSPDVPAAAAIWDGRSRTLQLARDRTGLYPLFYTRVDTELVAGPDARAILDAPGVSRELDPLALAGWLAGVDGEPGETLYAQLRRVPAGHVVVSEQTELRERRVWQPPPAGSHSPDDALRFGETLEAAVSRSLDGPAAVFLSGGIDSAAVTAAAAAASARAEVDPPLALSVHIEGASEEDTQRAVAAAFGLERRAREAVGQAELLERAQERAAVALWPAGSAWSPVFDDLAADARAAGRTAVLDGIGGDELLDAGLTPIWPALRRGRLLVLREVAAAERAYVGTRPLSLIKAALPRRRRWVAPSFIAPELHAELALRAVERRDDLLSTRLVAGWEETWDAGLRQGIAYRHPLWDAAVVSLVRGLPRESLVRNGDPKSPARSYLLGRAPKITGRWPQPQVADSLLAALERSATTTPVPRLVELGVVREALPDSLAISTLSAMLFLERWVRSAEKGESSA